MQHGTNELRRTAKEQFDRQAEYYDDQWARWTDESLRAMFELYQPAPNDIVLDVATGTGYTAMALAPLVANVVAADISAGMLTQARVNSGTRNISNIAFCEAAAEFMPFTCEGFSLITCRIAAHHFVSVESFLSECRRLLRTGGSLLLADTAIPDDSEAGAWQNEIEALRDPSHVRNRTQREWSTLFNAAGFHCETVGLLKGAVPIEVDDWMIKAGCTDQQKAAVISMLETAPQSARVHFELAFRQAHWYLSWYRVVIRAVRPL
jgi:ubiquinone/menaquinone biosynthesis C-methylase UbiE